MLSRATVELNSWNFCNWWIFAVDTLATLSFCGFWCACDFAALASVSPGDARSQLVLSVRLVAQFHTNVTELLKHSITRCAKRFENTVVQCRIDGGPTFLAERVATIVPVLNNPRQSWCYPAWVTAVALCPRLPLCTKVPLFTSFIYIHSCLSVGLTRLSFLLKG